MSDNDTFFKVPTLIDEKSLKVSVDSNGKLDDDLRKKYSTVAEQLNKLNKNVSKLATPAPPMITPQLTIDPKLTNQITKMKDNANLEFRKKKYKEAIDLYTITFGVAKERPWFEPVAITAQECVQILCGRADAYLKNEQYAEALVDAETIIAIQSDLVKGHYRKAMALKGMMRLQEAKAVAENARAFAMKDSSIADCIKEIDRLLSTDKI